MNKILLVALSVFVVSSCSDKEAPIGLWDDIIKLSSKNILLSAETDSAIVTTEGNWWWVDGISFNDSSYFYYDNEEVDLESTSYSIVEDNFVVERRDANTLFIKLNKNTTGEERLLGISLEAGDYFDHITVKQLN